MNLCIHSIISNDVIWQHITFIHKFSLMSLNMTSFKARELCYTRGGCKIDFLTLVKTTDNPVWYARNVSDLIFMCEYTQYFIFHVWIFAHSWYTHRHWMIFLLTSLVPMWYFFMFQAICFTLTSPKKNIRNSSSATKNIVIKRREPCHQKTRSSKKKVLWFHVSCIFMIKSSLL